MTEQPRAPGPGMQPPEGDPVRHWHALTTVEAAAAAARDPVLVLPLAAVEQHGPHLPLSTDLDIGTGLLASAFREMPEGIDAWALPPQAVGASREHLGFAGTLSLDTDALAQTLVQIGSALARWGVRRLVLSSSHGGNGAAAAEAALQLRASHAMLVVDVHYLRFGVPDDVVLPEAELRHGLHGGALETAMMLHLRPELVRLDRVVAVRSLGEELEEGGSALSLGGPARVAWMAGDLHPSGIAGDPCLGDAAMGGRLIAHFGRCLARVIESAKAFPLDRLG